MLFDTLIVYLGYFFFEKVNFEKISRKQEIMKLPCMQSVKMEGKPTNQNIHRGKSQGSLKLTRLVRVLFNVKPNSGSSVL